MTDPTLLGDVASVVDCEHKTAPACEPGNEFAFSVGTRALRGGGIDFSQAKHVDEETYRGWSRRAELRRGDVILAREAPIGGVGWVSGEARICLGQRTVLVRAIPESVDGRFLFYLLQSPQPQEWMHAHGEGSTVKHLNVSDVRRIRFDFFPPLDVQRRIAGVLGNLDDLIDTNEALIQSIRDLSQNLFESWIDHQAQPWVLSDVAVINPDKVKPGSGKLTYVDISSVGDGTLAWPEESPWDSAPSRARRGVKHGDVLWSTVRPNRRSHSLVLSPPDNAVVSTGFAVIRATAESIGPSYLFAATDRQPFTEHLVSQSSGSAYPATGPEGFSSALLPSLGSKTDDFERTLWPAWELAGHLSTENADLRRTRDELLPLLMSGRVVPGEVP